MMESRPETPGWLISARSAQSIGLLAAALASLTACGSDGPTGPQHANVSGAWTYSATNLSGTTGGVTFACNIEGASMSLSQTGTTFTGMIGSSIMSCFAEGQQASAPLPGAPVINGVVNGNNVLFDIETSHNTGSVSGNSMSGTVTVWLDIGLGLLRLTGNWGAVRT